MNTNIINVAYISVKAAAHMWQCSPQHVWRWARDGRIPGAHKLGHDWIIPATAIRPVPREIWQQRKVKIAAKLALTNKDKEPKT